MNEQKYIRTAVQIDADVYAIGMITVLIRRNTNYWTVTLIDTQKDRPVYKGYYRGPIVGLSGQPMDLIDWLRGEDEDAPRYNALPAYEVLMLLNAMWISDPNLRYGDVERQCTRRLEKATGTKSRPRRVEPLYKTREVLEVLGVNKPTLRKLVEAGEIPEPETVILDGYTCHVYPVKAVDAYANRQ